MGFPSTLRDIVAELYIGGEWVDISTDVLYRDNIEINRGRSAEVGSLEPCSLQMTLDNRAGDYSMRDPMGAHYGLLNRNNPIRLAVRHAYDDATSVAVSGWGSTNSTNPNGLASTPLTWTVTGTTSNYAKSGGKATHALAAAGDVRISYLSTVDLRDVEVRCDVTVPTSNVTGAAISAGGIMLHGQGASSEYYYLRLLINTNESVSIDFFTQAGVSITGGATTISGLTHTSSQDLRVAFQIEGRTLRAKVWPTTSAEPFEWHKTYSDNSTARPTLVDQRGWVGIRSSLVSGNTNGPITISYDNIEVRSYRAFAEVASWPSTFDVSGEDRAAPITANGISRRLAQGEVLQSPLRRYIPNMTPTPIFYWPLEDDNRAVAEEVEAVIGDGKMAFFQNASNSGSVTWGADKFLPGTLQAPGVTNGGRFEFTVEPNVNGTNWSMFWAHKISYDADAQVYLYTGNPAIYFYIVTYATGEIQTYISYSGVDTLLFTWTHPAGDFDDVWHTYVINCQVAGTIDLDITFYVDGVLRGSTTRLNNAMSGLRQVRFLTPPTNNSDTFLAHVAAWDQAVDAAALNEVAFGYEGETAGERMERLADEQGFSIEFFGDPADTAAVGAQRVDTLFNLLLDCEKADMGFFYEPKGTAGLMYRTRVALENQSAIASLDLSEHQVAPPFEPVEDDRYLRNDVTAKRVDGGDFRYELTSGRMSTLDPSLGGAGRYDDTYEVNVATDTQLPDIASWQVHLGTVDEPRHPALRVNFGNPETAADAALPWSLLDTDSGDLLAVVNADEVGFYDDTDQIVVGYTERLTQDSHTISFVCAPGSPYDIIVLDADDARLDSGSSTLGEDLDTTETGVDVVTTDRDLWDSSDVPYDVIIGGERMTVTAVTGATSPQTLTVTRSVNGVVKSHATGTEVHVYEINYLTI